MINVKNLFLNGLVFFLIIQFSYGQNKRVEIPYDSKASRPVVIPADVNGVVLVKEEYGRKKAGRSYYSFQVYDTLLQQKYAGVFDCDSRLNLNGYEYKQGRAILLFSSDARETITVVQMMVHNGEIEKNDYVFAKGFILSQLKVAYPDLILAGKVKKTPTLLKINLFEAELEILPLAFESKKSQIVNINPSFEAGAYVSVSMDVNRQDLLLVRKYNEGKIVGDDLKIEPKEGFDLKGGQVTEINKRELLILGSYSKRNNDGIQGFFITKYFNSESKFMKYYKFSELKNFYSFMGRDERKRAETKAGKKNSKGKDVRSKYRILSHDAIELGEDYLVVGEAYYPVYRTERVPTYYGGRSHFETRTIFDGFLYTHGVVACFDAKGNLKWDQAFKIEETKIMRLSERINVKKLEYGLELAFTYEGKVSKVIINNQGGKEEYSGTKVKTTFDTDKVKVTDMGDAEHWYGPYFITWGNQKIKNKSEEQVKGKRKVFYLNKLI